MKTYRIRFLLTCLVAFFSLPSAYASDCAGYASKLFGPYVCVFDAKQTYGNIQSVISNVYNYEQNNEFSTQGYALLFQPGVYNNLTVNVGYYTQVMGLGAVPDDTKLQNINVNTGRTTVVFWRSAENLSTLTPVTWAVSQASPLRNVHIRGALTLALDGTNYASGGFLANSQVDGPINFVNQQQWFTRNTTMSGSSRGNWNMVFVGDRGQSAGNAYPNTVIATTPQIQEKPYLTYDSTSALFSVIVPAVRKNASGYDWTSVSMTIPQKDFIIVQPGQMTAAQINTLLNSSQEPKALIFTPGTYTFDQPIQVNHDNTVVLGLGVPVLKAAPHTSIITTAADGVKIAGLLFDAGTNQPLNEGDPSLLVVGDGNHGKNAPTLLSDVYCRVGGDIPAQTDSCVTINDNNVIGDNLWLWRADHGAGAGSWTSDVSNHGLIVTGANVTMYGLAVEHFEKEQVLWSGENGNTYFYQSEMPYDVLSGNPDISASFVIANDVSYFTGYGFGIYDYFRSNPGYAKSSIETPNRPDISFTHMVDWNLGPSHGTIQNIIGTTDGHYYGAGTDANLPSWHGAS